MPDDSTDTNKVSKNPIISGIRWILRNTRPPNGGHWSQRTLSLAAGLTHTHISQILSGRQNATSLQWSTIQAIAEAAGVSPCWLASGKGTPYDCETSAGHDPYPMRRVVVRMAEAKGIDPSAISALLEISLKDADATQDERFWWERLFDLIRTSRWADSVLSTIDRKDIS